MVSQEVRGKRRVSAAVEECVSPKEAYVAAEEMDSCLVTKQEEEEQEEQEEEDVWTYTHT